MQIATEWKDYQVIATGNGEKLERWKNIYLLRPDPQIIWKNNKDLSKFDNLHAHYIRSSSGGGSWNVIKSIPEEWTISCKNLVFSIVYYLFS